MNHAFETAHMFALKSPLFGTLKMVVFNYVIVLPVLLHTLMCMVYSLESEASIPNVLLGILGRNIRSTVNDDSSLSNNAKSCTPVIRDQQDYYSTSMTVGEIEEYWTELEEDRKHQGLSVSSGAYEVVDLSFGFPFYGHTIRQVHISTAGTLSMVAENHDSPVSHYITPFLGHFNPQHSEESSILFENKDEDFIVEWRDVFLRSSNETESPGPFQFQVVINKNGTITFLYKKIPPKPNSLSTFAGLHSGVYIYTPEVNASVEYKGIKLLPENVRENTVITFSPKSACELAAHSKTCNAQKVRFYCKDCQQNYTAKGCEYTAYRNIYEWLDNNCKSTIPQECSTDDGTSGTLTKTVVIAVFAIVILVLLAVLSGWFYYAYTRPTSPSGRWLIAHRPSQWIGLIKNRGSANDDTVSSTSKDDDDDPGY